MRRDHVTIEDETAPLQTFREFFALERDVLVLSMAMFAFSLGFQMTNRFLPEYLVALGASGFIVGLFGTTGNIIAAIYPYPGGAVSDRLGSRYALTIFGVISTVGFSIWLVAPTIGPVTIASVTAEPWLWIFIGLLLAQAWKSFGIGATFAVVKQATDPSRLAAGFASTETFRRTAFLVGPVIAAVLIDLHSAFTVSFRYVLAIAVGVGILGTITQHYLYDPAGDTIGKSFAGVKQVKQDLREMPEPLRPLLVSDTLIRFANGMVYVFFVLVVTQFLQVGFTTTVSVGGVSRMISLSPAALFGYLLGIEMIIALLIMAPAAKLAEYTGLKPIVATGFVVYAIFPVILINTPPSALALVIVFAFSGIRFAGLPSHKALIVGPAAHGAGGRVTGTYYLLRNTIVIPSAAIGGYLWEFVSPEIAFTIATVIGLSGTGYFVLYGQEFEAYQ